MHYAIVFLVVFCVQSTCWPSQTRSLLLSYHWWRCCVCVVRRHNVIHLLLLLNWNFLQFSRKCAQRDGAFYNSTAFQLTELCHDCFNFFVFFFSYMPGTMLSPAYISHTCISFILHSSSFFKQFIFLLKDNCFTEFCCFLSNLNMNQPQGYIRPLPFETPSHLPPNLIPLGWYRAPIWVS